MSIPELCIRMGGFFTLVIFVFHLGFYRYFRWKEDFEKITILNRKILYTIHVALYLLLLLFGVLSFIFAEELSTGRGLAGAVTFGYALFWLWRLIWQIVYFRPLLSGVGRKTKALHYGLIAVFVVLFLVYLFPAASSSGTQPVISDMRRPQ